MTSADRFTLAGLDGAPPVDLDPQIWTRNLAAIRREQPELAAELERVTLAPHWRCARALDGSLTFRIEEPGGEPLWLGGTAAPTARAEGLLGALKIGEQNAVLPALAAGGELRYLLDSLPPHRAVYVFEDDLRNVAAVLRCAEYSSAIESGRFILGPPGDEAGFLDHQLSTHPGLLPPGLIICLPHVPQNRLEQVRAICERASETCNRARSQRLRELANAPVTVAAPARPPRLALLALRPDALAQRAAKTLEDAARQLGWAVLCAVTRTPRDVHVLVRSEQLVSFSPSLVVCLDHPFELPVRTTATVCEWHMRGESMSVTPRSDVLRLGASPHLSDLLRLSCPAGSRILDWYWGCEPSGAAARPSDTVLLIADLPDDDPAQAGVEQPSQKLIWKHAQQCVGHLWSHGKVITADAVLNQAEHAAGLTLPPGEARAALVRAIQRTLIPAALLRTIRQALQSGAFSFSTIGQGWAARADSEKEAVAFCSVWDFIRHPQPYRPIAAIFAGSDDPLAPELLQAAALGWPLLLYGPGGLATAAALGATLRPQDYRTFMDPRSLTAAVQDFRRAATRTLERASATAQHVAARHSYTQRLLQLERLQN